jgi:hypothetical protein
MWHADFNMTEPDWQWEANIECCHPFAMYVVSDERGCVDRVWDLVMTEMFQTL